MVQSGVGLPDPSLAARPTFASLERRLAAFVIDNAIEAVAFAPVGAAVAVVLSAAGMEGSVVAGSMVAGLLLDWLYFAAFESSCLQASPGKRLLGMRVQNLAGQRVSFACASTRYVAKIVAAAPLLAGILIIAFHHRRQGLHDVIAGTVVLVAKPDRAAVVATA